MNVDMEKVARNLKRLRIAAGLTQTALAELAEISIPSVSAIEAAAWADIKFSTMLALCRALNCSAHDIAGTQRRKRGTK